MMDFCKKLEQDVKHTIDKYGLFIKNDKILVALSGGKDSTTVAYMLKKLGYSVEAFMIDLEIGDYSKKSIELATRFCGDNNISFRVIRLKDKIGYSVCYIRSVLRQKHGLKSCTVCGVLKRYMLNRLAKELNATKIVTGHNLDDEAEAIMMNLVKSYPHLLARLGPSSGLKKHEGFVQRVKPLYFCKNDDIKRYAKLMGFPVNYDPCPCRTEAFRLFIKNLLNEEEKKNPNIKSNIVASLLNIMPKLKEKYKNQRQINTCTSCGEPARNEICCTCELLLKLKG